MTKKKTAAKAAPPADVADVAEDAGELPAGVAQFAQDVADADVPPGLALEPETGDIGPSRPLAPRGARPAGPPGTPRPALVSSRELARAQRADDWVEVRCTVANVHTSVGKMLSGQVEFLPPEEAAFLDERDLIKKV